jgi:hypothetical protein
MPSPFPGMNPYLEQDDVWHDFQKRFIARAADTVAVQVTSNSTHWPRSGRASWMG